MTARLMARVDGAITAFELGPGELVIGSGPGVGVRLRARGVADAHARITTVEGAHVAEDLGGGLLQNGIATPRAVLEHLDVLQVGEVSLVYQRRDPERTARVRTGIRRVTLVPVEAEDLACDVPVGIFTLGRSEGCNLVCAHPAISAFHARIERTGEDVFIEDLASANGTLVNGHPVSGGPCALRDGDVFALAGAESFRVGVEMGPVDTGVTWTLPRVRVEDLEAQAGWRGKAEGGE